MKRVFLIVLDSFGIGEMPDSAEYGDVGVNTLRSIYNSGNLYVPNMQKLGLFNIDGVCFGEKADSPVGSFVRLSELSKGKDTTIGHWEIAGVVSPEPLPTYPDGFPEEIINLFSKKTGRGVLCNKPYSGTEVIKDFGDEHCKTGDLIVYTSADSVFQIAAHEDIIPLEQLYDYCRIAREMLIGKHGVGRVIARPFVGTSGNYTRTANRHDFSIKPPSQTMLDLVSNASLDVISIGKIYDIFAGQGISEYTYTKSNSDGMKKTLEMLNKDFSGVCFTNLVDFDMLYGHRNNIEGYTKALNEFDLWLPSFMKEMREEDILIITADHGCDPGYTKSTDHSREYVPCIIYGKSIKSTNLGTREGFCCIGKTVCDYLLASGEIKGKSFLSEVAE